MQNLLINIIMKQLPCFTSTRTITILLLILLLNDSTSIAYQVFHDDDYVIIPSDDSRFSLHSSKISIRPPQHVDNAQVDIVFDAHLALIKGAANQFDILVRDSSCSLEKTSSFAVNEPCVYAVNGGPYQSYINGGCVGLIISNGQVIHSGYDKKVSHHVIDDNLVGFGLSYGNEWVLGDITSVITRNDSDVIEKKSHQNNVLKVKEFVNGLGWLIKDNKIIPTKDINEIYAPRTAIGVNSNGNLIILQVDGCERCLYSNKQRRGLTLNQMAHVMTSTQINATYAVNLDGGGSSTSVMNGEVINRPTCFDYVDLKCERPVGSVVCIKSHSTLDSKRK